MRVSPLVLALAAANALSQSFPVGEAVEKVRVLDYPGQSYALYLPSGYTPERNWPILYCLDPRSRGMIPIELYREAAEKHQFIIASSNNFMSDTSELEPVSQALAAIWNDTLRRFPIDFNRVYATGFSGGARIAWAFDDSVKPVAFAGIVGHGAGLPWDGGLSPGYENKDIAFYGLVGELDFNYYDVQGLREELAAEGIPFRIVTFEGGHQWGSKEHCSRAMDWLAVHDMKRGVLAPDESLVSEVYERGLREAAEYRESGRLIEAFWQLKSLVRDFQGLRDTSEASRRLASLENLKKLAELRKKRREEAETATRVQDRALGLLNWARKQPMNELPSLNTLKFEMRLSWLKKRARSEDRERALAAKRALENIFVRSAFYLPRPLWTNGDFERALFFLDLAAGIKPESWAVWYRKAWVEASAGHQGKAIDALEKAVERGFQGNESLRTGKVWAPLRGKERFQKLLGRLGERGSGE